MKFNKLFNKPYFDDKFFKKLDNFIQYGRGLSNIALEGETYSVGTILFFFGLCDDQLGITYHNLIFTKNSTLINLDRNNQTFNDLNKIKEAYFLRKGYSFSAIRKYYKKKITEDSAQDIISPNIKRFKIMNKNFLKYSKVEKDLNKNVKVIAQNLFKNVENYLIKNPNHKLVKSLRNEFVLSKNVRYLYVAMKKIQLDHARKITKQNGKKYSKYQKII